MTTEQRNELIDELTNRTKIRRSYFEELSDTRLLEEIDKLGLIY